MTLTARDTYPLVAVWAGGMLVLTTLGKGRTGITQPRPYGPDDVYESLILVTTRLYVSRKHSKYNIGEQQDYNDGQRRPPDEHVDDAKDNGDSDDSDGQLVCPVTPAHEGIQPVLETITSV